MALYGDFYLRPDLTSQGTVPIQGLGMACPDIIPARTAPIPNFQQLLSRPESCARDYSHPVLVGFDNYLYLRGHNGASSPVTRRLSLYYAPVSLICWPSQWHQNRLTTVGGAPHVHVTDVAPGATAVGDQAFIWRNVPPPPPGSDHYCLIARADDARTPRPLPGPRGWSYEDMGALIAHALDFGWKSTVPVAADTPRWSYSQRLFIPRDVGKAMRLHVYLRCTRHEGASVSFQCNTREGSSSPLELERTLVPSQDFVVGTSATLQPGLCGSITVHYWRDGARPVAGVSSLSLESAYDDPSPEGLRAASQRALIRPGYVEQLSRAAGLMPVVPIPLGCIRYQAC